MKFFKIIIILSVSAILSMNIFLLCFQSQSASAMSFKPQVGIPGFSEVGKDVEIRGDTIGKMIKAIYNYAIGIAGILAVVVMMVGGVVWITSAGNQERVGTAKSLIGASVTGLLLVLSSYAILKTVNPNLTELKSIEPDPPLDDAKKNQVKEDGCCDFQCNIPSANTNATKCAEYGGKWIKNVEGSTQDCDHYQKRCIKVTINPTQICCQWLEALTTNKCSVNYSSEDACKNSCDGTFKRNCISKVGSRCIDFSGGGQVCQ